MMTVLYTCGINEVMKRIFWIVVCAVLSSVPAAALPSTPVYVHGVSYAYIRPLCQQAGFQYVWDPFLRNVTVKSAKGSVKLHVGSPYILSQGRVTRLDDKVLVLHGLPAAPLSALPYFDQIVPETRQKPSNIVVSPLHTIRTVVIDPGHGGKDFGAVSPWGPKEKDLVLEVARLVSQALRENGLEVIMARSGDVFVPLSNRVRIANKKKVDLFVSIHANASQAPSLSGFEVYYLSEATDDIALADRRAENPAENPEFSQADRPSGDLKAILWDLKETENRKDSIRVAGFIGRSVDYSAPLSANRLRAANFYVLKWTECPAVLVELGYLTNRQDATQLESPEYKRKLADAVVGGILNYKFEFERTDGFTP